MTDLLIPLASPNPATTDWVPLGNTGSVPTTQPSVRVYRSTAQSIISGNITKLSFDTARYDRGPAAHWQAGSPTRLTCQVAGIYGVGGAVQFQASTGGTYRQASITVNGSRVAQDMSSPSPTTGYARLNPEAQVSLNVGDYAELEIDHDAGSALTLDPSAAASPEFWMALLGGQQGPPGFASPPTYATTLPASPVDGQEAILVDSVTNPTYQWRFRWNAGSSSAYKWEFVGGSPASNEITTAETLATTGGYADLATVGPRIFVPRAGDYDVIAGCSYYHSLANQGAIVAVINMRTSAGAGQSTYASASQAAQGTTGGVPSGRGNGLAANDELRLRYYLNAATGTFAFRWLKVTPIRVS